MKKKVVVGVSGGVDSVVSTILLKESGYDVIGMSMKLFDYKCMTPREDACCSPESINEAKNICNKIGIPFEIVDFSDEFSSKIIDYYVDSYFSGETPNPCIVCNDLIKFGLLLEKAKSIGADYLATGHYCKIEYNPDKKEYIIKKANDTKKDQSYMMALLNQSQLKHVIFPLANLKKEQTREIAYKHGFSVYNKKESQEACFIDNNDYRAFLKKYKDIKPGNFVHIETKQILGKHNGFPFYTIGQRKGLGLALKEPHYVIKIDAKTNTVFIGQKEYLKTKEFRIKPFNMINNFNKQKEKIDCSVKIRYSSKEFKGTLYKLENNSYKFIFNDYIFDAITPGQFAVFYNNDILIGGGKIEK